jgi:hypothetical protein
LRRSIGVRHKKAASKFDYKLKQLCNPCSKVKSIEVNSERGSNFNSIIGNEGLLEVRNAENTFLSPKYKGKKVVPILINKVPKAVKVPAAGSPRESISSSKAIPLNFDKQHKLMGASSALGFCHSSSPSSNVSKILVKRSIIENQTSNTKQTQMSFLKFSTKEKLKQVLKVCKQVPQKSFSKSQSKEKVGVKSVVQVPIPSSIIGASKKSKAVGPESKCNFM